MWFRMGRTGALAVVCIALFLNITGCGKEKTAAMNTAMDVVDQNQKLGVLNETVDRMYNDLRDGKELEARDELTRYEQVLTEIPFKGITSVEGVQVLTETVYQAKQAFNKVRFSPSEAMIATVKLRLATDALTHPHQPMWLQYYKVMKEDVETLQNAANGQDRKALVKGFQAMEAHYELIRPSILISNGIEQTLMAESLFAHMQTVLQNDPVDKKAALEAADQFQYVWDEIFGRKDRNTYAPLEEQPANLWPAALLCLIALILAYVGWQRYPYRQDYTVVRKPNGME